MQIKVVTTPEQFNNLSRIIWDKAAVEIALLPRRDGEYDLFVNYADSEDYEKYGLDNE